MQKQLFCVICWATALMMAVSFAAQSEGQQALPQHEKSSDCVTESGLLLCTACRVHEGLLPLLTPGNSDWRLTAKDEDNNPRFVSVSISEVDDEDDGDGDDDRKKDKHKKQTKNHGKIDKEKSKTRAGNEKRHHSFSRMPRQMPGPWQGRMSPMQRPMGAPGFMPNHPGLMQGMHGMMSNPTATNPEVLELLKNINGTLKSIESMMRAEQNSRNRSDNTRPMPSQQWGERSGPSIPNFGSMPSRGDGPRGDGPRGDGPRGDGPRGDGPRGDGPRGDGPRGDGPRGDGPRGDGPRGDGPRGDGPLRSN